MGERPKYKCCGEEVTEDRHLICRYHYLEKIQKLEEENNRLIEALIWCGGSRDFSETGIARQGWITICRPLIRKGLNV